ncbi:glycosyltransferase [Acidiphilium sp. AL]|nr:glycosyltransferase [Acidiphilium sp. AL]
MRIAIFCVGTRGDIQPFIALGRGLQSHGHQVTIATSRNFETDIGRFGLGFSPLTADYDTLMRRAPEMLENGMNVIKGSRIMVRHLAEMASHWAAEGKAAAKDAELLIGQGPATILAGSLSEALGIPVVQAQLQPMTPCTDIPPMVLPPIRVPIPGPVNLGLYHALRFFMWSLVRPPVNNHLRKDLGLEPYSRLGPLHGKPEAHRRTLYAYSEQILPRSRDWSSDAQVTGFWFLDEGKDWQPPDDLAGFLASGSKPVYLGFGSMFPRDAEHITRIVIAAIRKAGCRAVLATGWGGLAPGTSPRNDDIFILRQAPHDWLFPRMAAAVHHGGAGTMAAAVRAGIPSLILPFITEQAFWSVRLEQLGVAVPHMNRKTVTTDRLAAAIVRLQEPGIVAKAAALGDRNRAENGIGSAIRQMTEWGLLRPAQQQDRHQRGEQQHPGEKQRNAGGPDIGAAMMAEAVGVDGGEQQRTNQRGET